MLNRMPGADIRKTISDILKKVQDLIKAGELVEAMQEAERALQLDPHNPYIRALQEQIIERSKAAQPNMTQDEMGTMKSCLEQERRKHQDAVRRLEELRKKSAAIVKCDSVAVTENVISEKEQLRADGLSGRSALTVAPANTGSGNSSERIPGNRPLLISIDNDEELNRTIAAVLCNYGMDVKVFSCTDAALEFLQNTTPDLVLCEVKFPDFPTGGFSLYKKLRQTPHLKYVPCIFLSGSTDRGLMRSAKELGVDDYLSKPIARDHLLSTIKGKLRRYAELRTT